MPRLRRYLRTLIARMATSLFPGLRSSFRTIISNYRFQDQEDIIFDGVMILSLQTISSTESRVLAKEAPNCRHFTFELASRSR